MTNRIGDLFKSFGLDVAALTWCVLDDHPDPESERRAAQAALDRPRPGVLFYINGDIETLDQEATDLAIRWEIVKRTTASRRAEVAAAIACTENVGSASLTIHRGGISSDQLVRLLAHRLWGDRDRMYDFATEPANRYFLPPYSKLRQMLRELPWRIRGLQPTTIIVDDPHPDPVDSDDFEAMERVAVWFSDVRPRTEVRRAVELISVGYTPFVQSPAPFVPGQRKPGHKPAPPVPRHAKSRHGKTPRPGR